MNPLKLLFVFCLLAAIATNPVDRVRTFEDWRQSKPADRGKFIRRLCQPYEKPTWELEDKIKFRGKVIRLIDELSKTESGRIQPHVDRYLGGLNLENEV